MNAAFARRSMQVLSYVAPGWAARWGAKLFSTPRRIPRPDWEVKLVAKGKQELIDGRTALVRWGSRDAPAVLLVHGWAGRGSQLGFFVEPLLQQGYQVIALDGPAHGDSVGKRTNILEFAEAVLLAGRVTGAFRAVVAHSFGAAASSLALTRGLTAEKFVMVAAPSELQWIFDTFCRRMKMSGSAARAFQAIVEERSGIRMAELNIAKLADRISADVLIVHDPDDEVVPFKNAEELQRELKRSRLLIIKNVGHRKILKAPEFLRAVCEIVGVAQTASKINGSVTND